MKHSWQRWCCDRRLGGDRRRLHSLDYFAAGGRERRGGPKQRRRSGGERRRDWVRIDRYVSVYCGWPEDDELPQPTTAPTGDEEG